MKGKRLLCFLDWITQIDFDNRNRPYQRFVRQVGICGQKQPRYLDVQSGVIWKLKGLVKLYNHGMPKKEK